MYFHYNDFTINSEKDFYIMKRREKPFDFSKFMVLARIKVLSLLSEIVYLEMAPTFL